MNRITNYINENCIPFDLYYDIKESKQDKLQLPYTFDIYNEGPKNKDYKITKSTIYKIFFNIDKQERIEKDGEIVVKFLDHHSQMIKLPLPADKITYRYFPDKESTKNWTEMPEIKDYTWAGAWYSDKYVEYNYYDYNKDWNAWFRLIKPYMKGKVSVTIDDSGEKEYSSKILEIKVNNDLFNKEREEKIKELKDLSNLKKWAEEADRKEKEEIKRRQEEEQKRKEAEENWHKWWNSLSDDEKLSWSMGYGRGSGSWTGD